MANNAGKSLVTLLIGAAVGAAVGYLLYTDQDTRNDDVSHLKDKFNDLKSKLKKKGQDLEDEIYNS